MYKFFITTLFIGGFLWACTDSESEDTSSTVTEQDASYIQGSIRIEVTDELATKLENMQDSLKNAPSELYQLIDSLQIREIKRVFPYAGKFEARTRAEGLHRWYDITFDESKSVTRAANDFGLVNDITHIEKRNNISLTSVSYNDPWFKKQWYLNNESGADINIISAWNLVTPNPKVIIAVVDGGIDITHPELAKNIWVNTAELNGQEGVDDDGNEYIDDIYGFNFVTSSGTIVAHNHGTHVAGVIGAKNNNNIGICSIAGGCSEDDGVRLMSCQIFQAISDNKDQSSSDVTSAIKYGADNGALISQNSWCYDNATKLEESDKAAIDYFVKYAGMDENGNQVGLMKGGVVFFAAGNSHKNLSYPGAYANVTAVAAINSDYSFADYSNYGDWVDICAPGTNIYSTISNQSYASYDGTSMACPLVSGVAALVISKYGGDGFTNKDLIDRILNNTQNIDSYNPTYIGKMGSGLLDAFQALANNCSTIAPEGVIDFNGSVSSNSVTLNWSNTADEDDVCAFGYYIYYSKFSDFSSYDSISVLSPNPVVGNPISTTISNLDFESSYSFKIKAYDYSRNLSVASPIHSFTTGINHAPKIEIIDSDRIVLKSCDTDSLHFRLTDEDGHSMTFSYDGNRSGVTYFRNNDTVTVIIHATQIETGTYSSSLKVTDSYGLSSEFPFYYQILENHTPTATAIPNIYIGNLDDDFTLSLLDYFSDEDGNSLTFNVDCDNNTFYTDIKNNSNLYIGPSKYGIGNFTVTATDPKGLSCSVSFITICRNDTYGIDLYPNPVQNVLYLRVGDEIDTTMHVKIYNNSGVLALDKTIQVSTFAPASLDVSSLSSGSYTVQINLNGKSYRQNIVKL